MSRKIARVLVASLLLAALTGSAAIAEHSDGSVVRAGTDGCCFR